MPKVFILLCAKFCFDTPRHFEDIWESVKGGQQNAPHRVEGGRDVHRLPG